MPISLRKSRPFSLLLWIGLVASFKSTVAFAGPEHVIDMRAAGYPSPPCDYLFQSGNGYPDGHVEFLDPNHLIVKFPVRTGGGCRSAGDPWPVDFRSIIMDTSGKIVTTQDWSRPNVFNVQAGPDGNILEIIPGGIRILDQSFHLLQGIVLPENDFPKVMSPSPLSVQLSPSRHGFTVTYPEFIGRGFNGFSAYYADPMPMRQSITQNTDFVIVGDDILIPASGDRGFAAGSISVVLGSKTYTCSKGFWIAVPEIDAPVCLTSDFHLVELAAGSAQNLLADVSSMAPGFWHSGFTYQTTDSKAERLLLESFGVRFPVTDSWGFGSYRIVSVYDLKSGQRLFNKQLPWSSDVAISPDGRLLAVREKAKINIYTLQ